MGTPYLSEIRQFAFNYAPKNWAFCAGQLLPINQYQALFALLGTTYGGDGRTTFALPDLRGRVAMSSGSGGGGQYAFGQVGGETTHTLVTAEMPSHNHPLNANNATSGSQPNPAGASLGVTNGPATPGVTLYGAGSAQGGLASQTIGANPGGQAHPNMMPFLATNYCIALQGLYPSRN